MNRSRLLLVVALWLAAFSTIQANPDQGVGLALQPIGLFKAALSDSDLIPVEFEFHFYKTGADSGIGINGSFNNWGDVYRMQLASPPNIWLKTMYLTPANYQYKFVTFVDTVGQAGVTGWYTDPLNPNYSGPYRDSFIVVADPMIYYPWPMPGAELTDSKPPISYKISHSARKQLDANGFELVIDGVRIANAASFYNPDTRRFNYTPANALAKGAHTVVLRIKTTDGAASEYESTFNTLSGVIETPLTLTFDARGPYLNLDKVPAEATLEWMDIPQSHVLSDPDGDGYFTREIKWKLNEPHYYRIVVDKQIYLEYDPGNPLLSDTYRSVAINHVEPQGRFLFVSPRPDTILSDQLKSITIKALAVPGDSGFVIDERTALVEVDGSGAAWKLDASKNPAEMEIQIDLTPGRHVVKLAALDTSGYAFTPGYMAFGVYGENSGWHYIDAEKDDRGSGSYGYPAGADEGCADIRGVQITASANLDSLVVDVEMRNIDDETRLGFLLYNSLDHTLTQAAEDLDLKIPAWKGRGVYATLSSPQSSLLRAGWDNVLFQDPVKPLVPLKMKGPVGHAGHLTFAIALADLESVLGSYNQTWYVSLYSFLVNSSGSVELESAQGGVSGADEPDVYDVAFCNNDVVQYDLLGNYIYSYKIGGPRVAAIGSAYRGSWPLSPKSIDPRLGQGAVLRLRANGGDIFHKSVLVAGEVSDPAIAQVELHINEDSVPVSVNGGRFTADVDLRYGTNTLYAKAADVQGRTLLSKTVVYQCRIDQSPQVKIATSVTGQTVTLDGSGSIDPLDRPLTYKWTADPQNPQTLQWDGADADKITFSAPATKGEYYFNLTLTPSEGPSAWARAVVLVDSSGARTADLTTWHPAWIDRAVGYEIYTRSFSRTGRFTGVTSKLRDLRDLGVTVLYLRPIHPSTAIHGYWITDYYGLNPDYGTTDEFRTLVSEAHKLGLRVVIDYVVNHTVDMHPYMQDALAWGTDSPFHDFYRWNPDGTFHYYYTWINLPSINFESADTRAYLINMARWWVQNFDIDGFRCDVAHRIEKDRPSGPRFWQEWRAALKQMKPDIWLLGEADANDLAYYDKKFDSAYDYWWMNTLYDLNSNLNTADQLHEVVQYYRSADFPAYAVPKRSLEDFDGSRYLARVSAAQVRLAAAIQLTSPGLPMLYAGQEVGETTDRGLIRWTDTNQLKKYYQTLIQLRRQNIALSTGVYTPVPTQQPLVYAMMRADSFLVVANFSAKELTAILSVPPSVLPGDTMRVFYLNDQLSKLSLAVTAAALRSYTLPMPAQTVRIFKTGAIATRVRERVQEPDTFGLEQNFPNPFNPATEIRFSIGGTAAVTTTLQIINILGQRVRLLLDDKKMPGHYQLCWDGRDDVGQALGAGLYFYHLTAGPFSQSKKMLLIR